MAWRELAKHDEAAADCTRAIDLDRTFEAAYMIRGLCRAETRVFNGSIADMTIAIDVASPDSRLNSSLFAARAGVWNELNVHHLAVADLDEAIQLDPQEVDYYVARGFSKLSMKDWRGAIADAERALDLNSECVLAYVLRGEARNSTGEFALAKEDYERAVQLDPRNPQAVRSIANFLAMCSDKQLRNFPEAINHAKNLCQLSDWKDWKPIEVLANVYAKSGDAGEALKWQAAALQLAPAESQEDLRRDLELYEAKASALSQ